jgi:methyl-accepting chemotaxis protein
LKTRTAINQKKSHEGQKTKDNAKKTHRININGLFNFNSIRGRLVIGFMVPVLLMISLGLLSYSMASSAIVSSFEMSAGSTIKKTAEYYDLLFANVKSAADNLAGDSTLQQYYSGSYSNDLVADGEAYSEVKKKVSSVTASNSQIKAIFMFGKGGNDIYSVSTSMTGNEYDSIKDTDEAKTVDANRTAWFTSHEYLDKRGASDYGVCYARQIIGTSSRGVGYMFFDIRKDYLTSTLSNMDLGESSIIGIVAADGGESVVVDGQAADEGTVYFANQDFYQGVAESEEDSGYSYVNYQGKKQLFIYAKTSEGFTVCALIPRNVIVAQASRIKVITVSSVVIAIILAVIIGGAISANMGDAISSIMKKLNVAAQGDLTVRIHSRRKDEFRLLADGINDMIERMQELIHKTKEVSDKVDASAGIVTESARTLLGATGEIHDAIDGIETGIVQQAEDSESCMRQMDVLADKINVVSDNSEKMSDIAEGTRRTVQEGLETIDVLSGNVKDTVDITNEVIVGIQEMEESTRAIETIVSVINDIAAQTNLLSLNASIEAARAGDAGKGFSVVADEIRKLADQSVESVNQIRDIVQAIGMKTDHTVTVARRAEDVVSLQEKSLEDAVGAFKDIEDQVGVLIGSIDNISGGVENIMGSKTESINSIQDISAVSQETAATTEEVTNIARRQMEAVQALNDAATNLENNAKELEKAIGLFRV